MSASTYRVDQGDKDHFADSDLEFPEGAIEYMIDDGILNSNEEKGTFSLSKAFRSGQIVVNIGKLFEISPDLEELASMLHDDVDTMWKQICNDKRNSMILISLLKQHGRKKGDEKALSDDLKAGSIFYSDLKIPIESKFHYRLCKAFRKYVLQRKNSSRKAKIDQDMDKTSSESIEKLDEITKYLEFQLSTLETLIKLKDNVYAQDAREYIMTHNMQQLTKWQLQYPAEPDDDDDHDKLERQICFSHLIEHDDRFKKYKKKGAQSGREALAKKYNKTDDLTDDKKSELKETAVKIAEFEEILESLGKIAKKYTLEEPVNYSAKRNLEQTKVAVDNIMAVIKERKYKISDILNGMLESKFVNNEVRASFGTFCMQLFRACRMLSETEYSDEIEKACWFAVKQGAKKKNPELSKAAKEAKEQGKLEGLKDQLGKTIIEQKRYLTSFNFRDVEGFDSGGESVLTTVADVVDIARNTLWNTPGPGEVVTGIIEVAGRLACKKIITITSTKRLAHAGWLIRAMVKWAGLKSNDVSHLLQYMQNGNMKPLHNIKWSKFYAKGPIMGSLLAVMNFYTMYMTLVPYEELNWNTVCNDLARIAGGCSGALSSCFTLMAKCTSNALKAFATVSAEVFGCIGALAGVFTGLQAANEADDRGNTTDMYLGYANAFLSAVALGAYLALAVGWIPFLGQVIMGISALIAVGIAIYQLYESWTKTKMEITLGDFYKAINEWDEDSYKEFCAIEKELSNLKEKELSDPKIKDIDKLLIKRQSTVQFRMSMLRQISIIKPSTKGAITSYIDEIRDRKGEIKWGSLSITLSGRLHDMGYAPEQIAAITGKDEDDVKVLKNICKLILKHEEPKYMNEAYAVFDQLKFTTPDLKEGVKAGLVHKPGYSNNFAYTTE